MTAVTPTDRPKSVRNSCVIKVFGGVFMLSRCFLDCSVGVGVFVTGLSQISFFFSFKIYKLLAVTFIPAFTTNAMTSDFLLLISHGWVVTFPDSQRTVFIFRSWLDLIDVVLAFWISILNISKLLQNCWHTVIDITSFENIWKLL